MYLSVFDVFKIGIGPSSSHTVGPMVAASRFVADLDKGRPLLLTVRLHGSLAFTGKGHGTDRAIQLGLVGETPDAVDPDAIDGILARLAQDGHLGLCGRPELAFDTELGIFFDYGPPLADHSNGMVFRAVAADGAVVRDETFFSIGGGFVLSAAELTRNTSDDSALARPADVPHPFASAAEMLAMGEASGLSMADMKLANERVRDPNRDIDRGVDAIWTAMDACMTRGLGRSGTLPGGLKVTRRAAAIHKELRREHGANSLQPHRVMDWLSVYAMAVNEENAAGGRVVTAPTNGAAGVIPAVIRYYRDHCIDAGDFGIRTFLLTAAAIGGIIKHNASISGAEVGCQGEVGSASAMAAAGLAAALGGPTPKRKRRRDRARASSRHDLRSDRGLGAGAMHRAQCVRRGRGGDRRLTGRAW